MEVDTIDYAEKQYLIALRSNAEEGDEDAVYKLRQSFEAAKKAAKSGNAVALYNLGIHYGYAFGTQENDTKAFKCYEKAAHKGNADAMHYLAWAYGQGQGVEKDEQKYCEWEKKAAFAYHAEGKDDKALHCLRGIPRDNEISALLFQMRCDDQAKGIVSQINPETETYFADLAARLGISKKQEAGNEE